MSFSHLDSGTAEAQWRAAGVDQLAPIDPAALGRFASITVLAAHPDDEALGCPALLAHAAAQGIACRVIVCTLGEASHPGSPTHTPGQLAALRRAELRAAVPRLHPAAELEILGLPDGGLAAHAVQLRDRIDAVIARAPAPTLVVAPLSFDGHADHDALGRAAREAGERWGVAVAEYPVWFWHWAKPADARWRNWRRLPDPPGLDRAQLATRYPSQTRPLSAQPGDEAIVGPEQLAHHLRPFDTLAVTPAGSAAGSPAAPAPGAAAAPGSAAESGSAAGGAPASGDTAASDAAEGTRSTRDARDAARVFDRLHRDAADPWQLTTSPFERGKRDALLAELRALPGVPALHGHALEIGCSIGALTAELATVSDRVTAIDASSHAIAAAQQLTRDLPQLTFRCLTVPAEWPRADPPFDLVVLAETGYYLSAEQLTGTLERIRASTAPGFTLALCHVTEDIVGWPSHAREVHRRCLEFWPGAAVTAHRRRETERYVIDVCRIARAAPLPDRDGRRAG